MADTELQRIARWLDQTGNDVEWLGVRCLNCSAFIGFRGTYWLHVSSGFILCSTGGAATPDWDSLDEFLDGPLPEPEPKCACTMTNSLITSAAVTDVAHIVAGCKVHRGTSVRGLAGVNVVGVLYSEHVKTYKAHPRRIVFGSPASPKGYTSLPMSGATWNAIVDGGRLREQFCLRDVDGNSTWSSAWGASVWT